VRAGQRATVTVTRTGQDVQGARVTRSGRLRRGLLAAAPENATANFVKVVQRVPVKLVFERGRTPSTSWCPHVRGPGSSPSDEDRSPLDPVGARYARMRAAALAAEAAGFDGLWTWDHLRDPDEGAEAAPEAWTTLTRSRGTRRLTLAARAQHRPAASRPARQHGGHAPAVSGGRPAARPGRRRHAVHVVRARAGGAQHGGLARSRARPARGRDRAGAPSSVDRGRVELRGAQFRLDRPSGFLRPDPPPPISHRGLRPAHGDIAGRYGDGFTPQAMHPDLASWPAWRPRPTPRRAAIPRASASRVRGPERAMASPRRPSASVSSGWAWIA